MLSSLTRFSSVSKNRQPTQQQTPSFIAEQLKGQSSFFTYNTSGAWGFNCSSDRRYQVFIIYGTANSRSGIWVSNNFGSTFTNNRSTSDNYSGIVMSSSGQYMYINCQNIGRIYRSSDFGVTWFQVNFGTNISSITCNSTGQNVYCSNFNTGQIFASTNFGSSFGALSNVPSGNNTNIVNLIYIEPVNLLFYTSGNNGNLYRMNLSNSTNASWRPNTSSNNGSAVAVSDNGQYIYMTHFGVNTLQFSRSHNSGSSFINQSITIVSGLNNQFAKVCCSPSGQYVYLINYGTHLYFSSDYGVTFNNRQWNTVFPGGFTIEMIMDKTALVLYSGANGFILT